jgi:hypothetical protein
MKSTIEYHEIQTHIKWFIKTEYGHLTERQEVFAWRYALHGRGIRAIREAFNRISTNSQNQASNRMMKKQKVLRRIEKLLDMHRKSEIDLTEGPWKHYGDKLVEKYNPEPIPNRKMSFEKLMKAVSENER